ncbi:MAG TPA: hypothetical protein VFA18_05850 [Gemmataceae bacterium]|nr:hypothetical protein [Gemmataceae bacterium]
MNRQLGQTKRHILATGRVDSHDLEVLRGQLYANGPIDRPRADFLVELRKQVQHLTPAFEQLFFQAIKEYILADSWIDAEHAGWLRRMLCIADDVRPEERKFLQELSGEAKHVSREFEALLADSLKLPSEIRP